VPALARPPIFKNNQWQPALQADKRQRLTCQHALPVSGLGFSETGSYATPGWFIPLHNHYLEDRAGASGWAHGLRWSTLTVSTRSGLCRTTRIAASCKRRSRRKQAVPRVPRRS